MRLSRSFATLAGQVGRFGASGVVNTAIGVSVIFLLTVVGGHYALANAIGYGVGLLTSFLLNRNWTFKAQRRGPGQAFRFVLVFAVAYSVNLAVLTAAVEILNWDAVISQMAAIAAYVVLSFIGMKFVVFVERGDESSETT